MSFTEAQAKCTELDAFLPVIRNQAENCQLMSKTIKHQESGPTPPPGPVWRYVSRFMVVLSLYL